MGRVLVLVIFSIPASSNFSYVLSDLHKSLLGWCKFDKMVDLKLSIKNFDNFIGPQMCDYSSKASKWSFSLCFRAFFLNW